MTMVSLKKFSHLHELVHSKQPNTNGIHRHEGKDVALVVVVAAGFIFLTLHLLLHHLPHLLYALHALALMTRVGAGVHVEGLSL